MDQNHSQRGFSFLEILVVVIVLFVLVAIAAFSIGATRRNVKTNVAANMLFSLLHQAHQRAITNRLPHLVTIRRSPDTQGKINLVTLSVTDDTGAAPVVFRQEYLPQDIILTRPTNVSTNGLLRDGNTRQLPTEVTFDTNGEINFFFNPDGSATTVAPGVVGTPFTGSIYVADNQTNSNSDGLTRALSIYNSTGEVRYWFYNGSRFVYGSVDY
ncbi:MAG: prepilin-type N-terminal cleavage/methylation domain-containing protein [Acidobacteriota bacterium]